MRKFFGIENDPRGNKYLFGHAAQAYATQADEINSALPGGLTVEFWEITDEWTIAALINGNFASVRGDL